VARKKQTKQPAAKAKTKPKAKPKAKAKAKPAPRQIDPDEGLVPLTSHLKPIKTTSITAPIKRSPLVQLPPHRPLPGQQELPFDIPERPERPERPRSSSRSESFGLIEEFSFEDPGEIPQTPGQPVSSAVLSCPFTILCDTSEQLVYTFSNISYENVHIKVRTEPLRLPVGDYTIKELPGGIIVERKSFEDFIGSVSTVEDREVLSKRLGRMIEAYDFSAMVIECEGYDLYTRPFPFTKLDQKTPYHTILSWSMRYPQVHWYLCRDRAFAELTVFRLFEQFWKHHHEPTPHRKGSANVIHDHLEAFRLGIIGVTNLAANALFSHLNPYPVKDARSGSWLRGAKFYRTHFLGHFDVNPISEEESKHQEEINPDEAESLFGDEERQK
jgi:ERCC4-type nuclease